MSKTKPKPVKRASTAKAAATRRAAAEVTAATAQPARDLRGAAKKAAAEAVTANLGATQTLAEFLATTGALTVAQRQQIVEQALVMLDGTAYDAAAEVGIERRVLDGPARVNIDCVIITQTSLASDCDCGAPCRATSTSAG